MAEIPTRRLRAWLLLAAVTAATSLSGPAPAQTEGDQKPLTKQTAPDPNEKVCEDITQTGSRLGTKRFCAPRSEWEDKRRQDRESTEKAQVMSCMPNIPGCK